MSKIRCATLLFAFTAMPSIGHTQETPMLTAQPIAPSPAANTITLPANTPISVRVNEELNTRRNREGDTFYLSVASNVIQDGFIIIPAGSRAIGTITWLTKKGAFGKSGKMDISITAIEIGGTRIPVIGTFRQEGEGNTVATVGAVVVASVFAVFVTGRSGVIPAGRELEVHTRDALTVGIPANAHSSPAASAALATPLPVQATVPVQPQ